MNHSLFFAKLKKKMCTKFQQGIYYKLQNYINHITPNLNPNPFPPLSHSLKYSVTDDLHIIQEHIPFRSTMFIPDPRVIHPSNHPLISSPAFLDNLSAHIPPHASPVTIPLLVPVVSRAYLPATITCNSGLETQGQISIRSRMARKLSTTR